jgi:two-component system, cell cycle response regulator DivK
MRLLLPCEGISAEAPVATVWRSLAFFVLLLHTRADGMKQLLVVEDDPTIMSLIVILLERAGYDVVQARSAEEGLRLAAENPPNLILMDVALPGMDGLEATRLLKSRPGTAGVPVVALTAQAMKQDVERASLAGCDGVIVKPLSRLHFLGEVARFLESEKR